MRVLLILFTLLPASVFAGKLSGYITDSKKQALPFSSITIKGTLKGTTANNAGYYSLELAPGAYTLVVQHIGFRTIERRIEMAQGDMTVNIVLSEQQYDLGTVIVKQGEDPAYAIIRNAIKKRKFYEKEIKKFETEVYIKGQVKTRDYPKKFLGKEVDFEDADTSKRKIIFLSETIARYSVDEPKRKVEVISTKVSGDKDAFGFGSPQIFSFYENTIFLGNLNPRGFISPIADNALNYYKYRFDGTFFENNQMVSRIQVTPKRAYEPLFNGQINIIENEWRIQSVQLFLFKRNQVQFVDTLKIEQLYVPFKNTWFIKQQTISPATKLFGFDIVGSFVQVYDKFNLAPVFAKGFFNNTIIRYEDSSNKKATTYWDSVRPVPLLQEEISDYTRKDSLERVKQDPHYLDSVDRKRNKISPFALVFTGQTFTKEKRKSSLQIGPLLNNVNFNTIEGAVVDLAPVYTKRLSNTGQHAIYIRPYARYGFSNLHFTSDVKVDYTFSKKFTHSFSVAGGKKVFQFNNNNPISPEYNTISSLRYEQNYMKIYEAVFGRIKYTRGIGAGISITTDWQYQNRIPLENTTTTKWKDIKDRSYTPNFTFTPHQALTASVQVNWRPGSKYIEFPQEKISVGSRFPTFSLSYTQGIKDLVQSDVDYSKWRFSVNDNLQFKLFGALNYDLAIGGFLNSRSVFFPDYQHYQGNLLTIVSPSLNTFLLMPYYAFSNTEKFYSTAHVAYHFNGLITNKIPLFKKLNWFLVASGNGLLLRSGRKYAEASIGLENILKIIRVDYVTSFTDDYTGRSGIRVLLPFF